MVWVVFRSVALTAEDSPRKGRNASPNPVEQMNYAATRNAMNLEFTLEDIIRNTDEDDEGECNGDEGEDKDDVKGMGHFTTERQLRSCDGALYSKIL